MISKNINREHIKKAIREKVTGPGIFNPDWVREELEGFFENTIYGSKPLIYFDYTATAPQLKCVSRVVYNFNTKEKANVHRGQHFLSLYASEKYDTAHEKVADLFNARREEIVFGGNNATYCFNQIALSLGDYLKSGGSYDGKHLKKKHGGNIVLTVMEHSSNTLPWMELARRNGFGLRWVDINPDYELDLNQLEDYVDDKTRVVAVTQASNVLGTINDIKEITKIAHKKGAIVVVDAVQSAPHVPIDVKDLDCDFLVVSGHKIYAPCVGIMYGKKRLLENIKPAILGGGTIVDITRDDYFPAPAPDKWEAGTPDIGNCIGLGVLTDYLAEIGRKLERMYNGKFEGYKVRRRQLKIAMDAIRKHEMALSEHMIKGLDNNDKIEFYGPRNPEIRVPTFSFNIGDMVSEEGSLLLDRGGVHITLPVSVATRDGCHCAFNLLTVLTRERVRGTVRASLGWGNTEEDVKKFLEVIKEISEGYAEAPRDMEKSERLKSLTYTLESNLHRLFLSPEADPYAYSQAVGLQTGLGPYGEDIIKSLLGGKKLPVSNRGKVSDSRIRKILKQSAIGFAESLGGFGKYEETLKNYNEKMGLKLSTKPWCYEVVKRHFDHKKEA